MTEVICLEESVGYHQQRTYVIDIPASAPNTLVEVVQPLTFAFLAWRMRIHGSAEQRGDFLSLCINPNQLIGALVLPAAIGATTITVDATAATYAWVGQYLTFNDPSMEKVQIKSISGVVITLVTPLTNAHAAATVLGMCVKLLDYAYLDGKRDIKAGFKGFRGQQVPTDSEVLLEYTNSTGRPKTILVTLEYYTGE